MARSFVQLAGLQSCALVALPCTSGKSCIDAAEARWLLVLRFETCTDGQSNGGTSNQRGCLCGKGAPVGSIIGQACMRQTLCGCCNRQWHCTISRASKPYCAINYML